MSTYILTWSPDQSDTNVEAFNEILKINRKKFMTERDKYACTWIVDEHDKVSTGDRFYMVSRGTERAGIVMCGQLIAPAVPSGITMRGRQVYYCFFKPHVVLSPDCNPAITTAELRREIPDFQWDGGESGRVLTPEQALKIDKLWIRFMMEKYDRLANSNNKTTVGCIGSCYSDDLQNISEDTSLHETLSKIYGHKCDFCGVDFEYVYGRFNRIPRMSYHIVNRQSTLSSRPIRSIKCCCCNCEEMLEVLTLNELSSGVRAVNNDPTVITFDMAKKNISTIVN